MARPTTSVSVARRGSVGGDPERTVLWVRGDHDLSTRVAVAVGIARAAQLEDVPLLVDLSEVTFMDASIAGAIAGCRERLRSREQSLEVRAPSPPALRVLGLCGLTHLVHCEAIDPTGAAGALASWVDVPPSAPAGRIVDESALITGRPGARQPARVPAAAGIHVKEAVATPEVDRGGP